MQNPELFFDAASGLSMPVLVEGEVLLLKRTDMHFAANYIDELGVPKKIGQDGYILVSTLRIVFIANTVTKGFIAFDLPLSLIRDEGFYQPIFGSNYLYGVLGRWQVGPTNFKLYFYNGGAGVFLKLVIELLQKHRSNGMSIQSEYVTAARKGTVQEAVYQAAYVDPTDQSTVFLAQPINVPTFGVEMQSLGTNVHTSTARPQIQIDKNKQHGDNAELANATISEASDEGLKYLCHRCIQARKTFQEKVTGDRSENNAPQYHQCAVSACRNMVQSQYKLCNQCARIEYRCIICKSKREYDESTVLDATDCDLSPSFRQFKGAKAKDDFIDSKEVTSNRNSATVTDCISSPKAIVIPSFFTKIKNDANGSTKLRRRRAPVYDDYTKKK